MASPFRSYSSYLKERYGAPVHRVAVDGGFSCPNRGSDRTAPGCAYCDSWGSRAPYLASLDEAPGRPSGAGADLEARKASLSRQIARADAFLSARYGPGERLLYFQAFTGTYGPPEILRELYDHALARGEFRELIVSTRPDCIDRRVAELLAAYRRPDREVWVELGLQSAHDRTLVRVRRGHTVAQFREAFLLLRELGLRVAVHVIFGLPGEGLEEILETTGYLAALGTEALKIHNLHVPRGCALAGEALAGELTVPCDRRHLQYTMRALELLDPRCIIMRLTCDTPPQRLLLPRRFMAKPRFYQELRRLMEKEGTWQGRLYRPDPKGVS
ncbi:MAG: TIGR01212 family radical SAM protein [Spirochaetales bacterium]|nr:TIGR01212 family radical SAM protein [Spirochaetales bacterium]